MNELCAIVSVREQAISSHADLAMPAVHSMGPVADFSLAVKGLASAAHSIRGLSMFALDVLGAALFAWKQAVSTCTHRI